MSDIKRSLRVFLCHASGDKPAVTKLYHRLVKDGIDAWLDNEKLIPGQDWRIEIPKAVKNSDVVIVCLSSQSVTKEGFVQKEIRFALDTADEKPDGTIFIIPARLENCTVPDRINRFQWVDLFSDDGYERLFKALRIRATGLEITLAKSSSPIEHRDVIFPEARYFEEYEVLATGSASGVNGWATIAIRNDDYIPTTIGLEPPQAVIETFILIQNTSNTTAIVTASRSILTAKDGKSIHAFKGEDRGYGYNPLAPTVLEINGEDCSVRHLDSVMLKHSDFCVLRVSFPVDQRFRTREAIEYCKEILVSPILTQSKNETKVVLVFF